VYKKLIKNSQPFWKKFQKTVGGIFFLLTLYLLTYLLTLVCLKDPFLVDTQFSFDV